MKLLSEHLAALAFALLLAALPLKADVAINEANFPDANFRNFLTNKLSYYNAGKTVYPGVDGVLTTAELSLVKNITCTRMSIASLQGIEHFKSMTILNCDNNALTQLDVSQCSALGNLNANNNALEQITLNAAVKDVALENNKLTLLDASHCTALTRLQCTKNLLQHLKLNPAIQSVDICHNPLGSVNNIEGLNSLSKMTYLCVMDCGLHGEVDLSHVPLTNFNCCDNAVTALRFKDITEMAHLLLSNNRLTELPLAGCTKLKRLLLDNNLFSALDGSDLVALEHLNVNYNPHLTEIDFRNSDKLKGMIVKHDHSYSAIKLKSMIFEGLDNLTKIWMSPNIHPDSYYAVNYYTFQDCTFANPSALDIQLPDKLNGLSFIRTNLVAIPDLEYAYLQELTIQENADLTKVGDFDACTALRMLYCNDNTQLQQFQMGDLPNLYRVDCANNVLERLVLGECPKLEYLTCSANHLATLNLSAMPKLAELDCHGNRIEELDVSGTQRLMKLNCSHNSLKRLITGNVRYISNLDCSYNSLTELDLSRQTVFSLNCSNNNLTDLNCDHFGGYWAISTWSDKVYEIIYSDPDAIFTDNNGGQWQYSETYYDDDYYDYFEGLINLTTGEQRRVEDFADGELYYQGNEIVPDAPYYHTRVVNAQDNIRTIQADVARMRGGKMLYYLRLDDNGETTIIDRMRQTSHNGISLFDLERVVPGSWIGGTEYSQSSRAPQATIAVDELDDQIVAGKILVLTPENKTESSASGTLTYDYLVDIISDAPGSDNRVPNPDRAPVKFTLRWTANPSVITSLDSADAGLPQPVSVTYTDAMGRTARHPFSGVNIVVTRYSDGTATTSKLIK